MENLPMEYPGGPANLEEAAMHDGGFMEVATARSAQEVQAMVIMAKKFPRNTVAAEKRILDACKRKGLAEVSQYSFNRGGATVEGPSIRLAEVLAQNWGNLDYGIVEVDRKDGVSTMLAYCWDIETNVRRSQVFTVAHIRDRKAGARRLTEERDIYELTSNNGSRRVRACILAVIPGDIVDAAVAQCDITLSNAAGNKPMKERISDMVKLFERFEVSQDLLEKFLGHPLTVERVTEPEMLRMKKIFLTIQDKQAKAEDYFMMPKSNQVAGEGNSLKDRVAGLMPDAPAAAPAVQARPTVHVQTTGEAKGDADYKAGDAAPPLNHQPYVEHEAADPFSVK